MFDYYPAYAQDVHDGDTIKFEIDLGLDTYRHIWIRLKDVWCPELNEPGGIAARDTVDNILVNGIWRIKTFKVGKLWKESMTFVRYVGVVTSLDGTYSLNQQLIDSGFSKERREWVTTTRNDSFG